MSQKISGRLFFPLLLFFFLSFFLPLFFPFCIKINQPTNSGRRPNPARTSEIFSLSCWNLLKKTQKNRQVNKYMLIWKVIRVFSGFWEARFEPSRVFAGDISAISSFSSAPCQSFRREFSSHSMENAAWMVFHAWAQDLLHLLSLSCTELGWQDRSPKQTWNHISLNEQCWMALEFPWEFCWNEPAWFVRRKMHFSLSQCPFPCRADLAQPWQGSSLGPCNYSCPALISPLINLSRDKNNEQKGEECWSHPAPSATLI